MSSQEEDVLQDGSVHKKRRGPACDKCRSKKVRCDGKPGERCSNCIAGKHECTFLSNAKKRYPDLARIEELETQVENLKKLLNKLHPGVDFTPALNGYLDNNSLWMLDPSDPRFKNKADAQIPLPLPRPTLGVSGIVDSAPDELDPSDDEGNPPSALERSFKAMSLHTGPPRFLGKSSRFSFFKKAFKYKYEQAGLEPPDIKARATHIMSKNRTELLMGHQWVIPILQFHEDPHSSFPDRDLMESLINLYFDCINTYLPVLHRPTFDQHYRSGLHLLDEGFGSVLLLVCAIGARYSTDRRVLLEGTDSWYSAGCQWFNQVRGVRKLMNMRPPKLTDMQVQTLSGMYLFGSVINQPTWVMVGMGLRIAQEMGAHRKRRYGDTPTVEGELTKRAFWVLVALDRSLAAALGRACALQDEDMDVEYPIECDDEYWVDTDNNPLFEQPKDKPSKITFFNASLRLKQIHAFALRTIYAINRSKVAFGRSGPQWEQDIVSEIDSALNSWKDAVPAHLQWDPRREHKVFFNQSAVLWCAFYTLQINIHRAFIPSPRKPSKWALPSLAICTHAARSCIHILEEQFIQSESHNIVTPNQNALFSSAIVLLLNVWGTNRFNDSNKDMAEVHKAMKMLKEIEPRLYIAGRYYDILYELANVGDLPLPQIPPQSVNKRSRSSDTVSTMSTPSDDLSRESRPIAGSKRLNTFQQSGWTTPSSPEQPQTSSSSNIPSNAPKFQPSTTSLLAGLPPLSGPPSVWPSTNSISPLYPHAILSSQQTSYPPGSLSPGSFTFDPPSQPVVAQPFPPLTQGSPTFPSAVPNTFETTFPSFVGPGADAVPNSPPHAGSSGSFGTDFATSVNGILDNDTLAMWSLAPFGFEWDEWGTYASSMTELAGGSGNPMNM